MIDDRSTFAQPASIVVGQERFECRLFVNMHINLLFWLAKVCIRISIPNLPIAFSTFNLHEVSLILLLFSEHFHFVFQRFSLMRALHATLLYFLFIYKCFTYIEILLGCFHELSAPLTGGGSCNKVEKN